MSAFEFGFTLFGLVLGLALTAVLAGFAGVLKARSSLPDEQTTIRFGWLTPMLALIVVVDLITFWLSAWGLREVVQINLPVLIVGAALTSIYFVTASLIFPDQPALWPDLDEWFDRHKGQIGGGIAVANIGFSITPIMLGKGSWGAIPIMQYAYIVLVASLRVTRHRWQSLTILIGLLLLIFWSVAGLPII